MYLLFQHRSTDSTQNNKYVFSFLLSLNCSLVTKRRILFLNNIDSLEIGLLGNKEKLDEFIFNFYPLVLNKFILGFYAYGIARARIR